MGSVLIADQDPASRDLLAQALEAEGRRIETAASGGEVLQRMAKEETEVLIIEVHLPDMSAWELIPRVHRLDLDIPVVAITADDSWETSRRVRVEGGPIFFYALKPLDLEELRKAVAAAIRWRQKQRPRCGRRQYSHTLWKEIRR